MSTFRIISFDGGGIRGAFSTVILRRLAENNKDLLTKTDLFAGTSTGAIIALALANELSPKNIDNLYSYENIKKIFTPKHINLLRPRFSNKNLREFLCKNLPKDKALKDLNKKVFIPAFNIKGLTSNKWQGVFFNNISPNITYEENIIDVALASSAAPTYFPSHRSYIDGGVMTNSPSMAAIATVLHNLKNKYNINDFRLLSIGTGTNPKKITANTKGWGIFQWIYAPFRKAKFPIINIFLDTECPLEDIYCSELLKKNYMRINPILKSEVELDDYRAVPNLRLLGENYNLDEAIDFINNYYLK